MKRVNKTTSDKVKLLVTKRTIFGKKLASLRRGGKVPGNIFGPLFKSQSIAMLTKDFTNAYKVAKETAVIYLDFEKTEIPVLITHVQRHPVHDQVLHVDFRKIDLKKKVEAHVPVVTAGVSEAVSQKGGVLLHGTETLKVEALPSDMPQQIVVDISSLKELRQEIKVINLPKSPKYEIKEAPERVVISVVEHKEQSVTPETASAAPEITTAVPVEGAETTEGEAAPTAKEGDKEKAKPESDKKAPEPSKSPKKAEEKK